MSTIKAKNNFDTNDWLIDFDSNDSYVLDLHIGFIQNNSNETINFVDLSFGFTLTEENNTILLEKNYPPENVTYIKTDQEFISFDRMFLTPGKNYSLSLWVKNNNIHTDKIFSFYNPIPKKEYDSWLWVDNHWVPPFDPPDEDNFYYWDEPNQQWVLEDPSLI